MSLHPVTDEERKANNPKAYVSNKWTICELLRKIYILAEARNDIKTMCLSHDALCYAKRMNLKLGQKDPKYGEEWYYGKREKKDY